MASEDKEAPAWSEEDTEKEKSLSSIAERLDNTPICV